MSETKKSDIWNLWESYNEWRNFKQSKEFPVNIYFNFDNIDEASPLEHRYARCTWHPSDDLTRYQKMGNKKYLPEEFFYDVNRNLFRCDDFEKINNSGNPQLLVYGCSHTFGIGIPEKDAWGYILKEMLEEKHNQTFELVNLAVPGGSADDIRLMSLWQDKFNPTYICALMPPYHRASAAVGKKIKHYTPSNPIREPKELYDSFDMLASTLTEHFTFNSYIVSEQLKTYGRLQNAKVYTLDSQQQRASHINPDDLARDGSHYGRRWHEHIARQFFQGLTNE